MQVSVLKCNGRVLSRSAAILLVGSLAAGCSAGASRFAGGVDDIFTASTPNQREIIRPQAQTYPGNEVASAAPVDSTYTGSVSSGGAVGQPVSRSALPPVSSTASSGSLAPVASAPAASAPVRVASAPVEAPRSGTLTAPTRAPEMATGETDPAGWSRAGGTQVTIKDGETLYNLSRRFGVPVNVIAKVNGLSESAGLQTGQKVVIPTYVYSKNAPVSAPDNNPKVAAAKSSTGNKEPATEKVATAKPAAGTGAYTVQEGDTLSRIAKTLGVSTVALRQANGLDDGPIRVGQTLTVPAGGKTTVAAAPAKVDPVVTSSAPAKQPAKAEQVASYTPPKKSAEKTMEQAEQDQAAAPDATGIGKMRWPVRGRVVSGYGKGAGKASDGIDIAVPEGTPVKAAENGIVIYAGDGLKEFGNTVLVRHENGLVTVYGNASELKVSRGDKVKRGQDLALSGMTGNATAPKLHFEVRKNSAPVDPSTYLE